MSVFTIYAIVLTGIYIIYYPVTIMMDLFGKKGQKKDGVEVFNTGDMTVEDEEVETGTVVSETADGYHVGDLPETSDSEQTSGDAVQQPEPEPQVLTPAEEQERKDQELYDSLLQENYQVIVPEYQEEYDSASYLVAMQQPINTKSKILRQIIDI